MNKTKSLIKQLNLAAKNLSVENQKIFTDIIVYVRTSNIKSMDAEEFLQQLLDSFLNAEQKGVAIETVLGTTDVKHYCDEVVNTYKSNYSFTELYSEHIMYFGIIISILSVIDYIFQCLNQVVKHGFNSVTLSSNFSLGTIFQFLLISSLIYGVMKYIKKSCFTETVPTGKVKDFFKLWGFFALFFGAMFISFKFLDKIILFQLNIIVVFLIGITLYFVGNYLSEN